MTSITTMTITEKSNSEPLSRYHTVLSGSGNLLSVMRLFFYITTILTDSKATFTGCLFIDYYQSLLQQGCNAWFYSLPLVVHCQSRHVFFKNKKTNISSVYSVSSVAGYCFRVHGLNKNNNCWIKRMHEHNPDLWVVLDFKCNSLSLFQNSTQ